MKKKIIFVTEALWLGGIEISLVNVLKNIDYDRFDVTVLALRNYRDLESQIPAQCRLIIADRMTGSYPFKRLFGLMEKPRNAAKFRRFIWKVLCLLLKAPEAALWAKHIRTLVPGEHFDTAVIYDNRTAETVVRGIPADRYLMFYHHGAMRREYHDEIGYKKSEKIITVSEKTVDMLKAFRPDHAHKIIVLHNIVDIENVLTKSREPVAAFPAEAFHLVSCGRLTEAKGIDWAIQAMRCLMDKGFTELHWWVVGGGPDEESLKHRAEAADVADHFHFLGMQSNPYPYIANADLYIQPSRFENYSVVILEAMTLCKPILATIPAAAIQIQSGENGLLCEPDPESIARGIEYLYHHREEMDRYVQTLKENSLEKQNEEILNSLYRLLG